MTAEHLRCEYLVNPLGIDVRHPRLSWTLEADGRNQHQSAYRILVASDRDRLNRNEADLWDSGRVDSSDTVQIGYAGKPLASRTSCVWKVRVWDGNNRPSAWSTPAAWTMGLLTDQDWTSRWIGQPTSMIPKGLNANSPWFRKVFALDARPIRAVAYVACMGYYGLHLGGNKVGDSVLAPAVSNYAHRIYYVTHEVTSRVHQGKNCIALWLGRGWYVEGLPGVSQRGPIVRVQLEITLEDGRTISIDSDRTWKTHISCMTTLRPKRGFGFNYGGGERYDARDELPGWNTAGLDDSDWNAAAEQKPPAARLVAQMIQPNRLVRQLQPRTIEALDDGQYLVDMGRNFNGWFQLRFQAQPDTTVQLEYHELRPPDEERNNYLQIDQCAAKDRQPTVFRNRFNYHAFRWVKISGLSQAPSKDDIKAWLVDTDFHEVGNFACSNRLLTRIYQTVAWTYRCVTLGGYAVDCPHRERLGYGGDGQVTMETGLYTFDVGAMNTKWLGNWRDAQNRETGELPNTAPYPRPAGGGPTWGAICVMLPWQMYLHYGDHRVLQQNYDMMQRYIAFLDSKSRDDLLRPYGHEFYGFIGDWVAPDRDQRVGPWSSEELRVCFNNVFYVYLHQLMEKIATVLDKPGNATRYREKGRRIAHAVQARFFKPDKNVYATGEQPYLAFPLYVGLVPKPHRKQVLANLEKEIVQTHKGHLHSGMHGTYFLLKCLNQAERDDLIFQIVNQRTYPGWGYMLDQGATTIWERWDGKYSRIHSTLLSIGPWFPAGICGIQPDEHRPGFEHVWIRPRFVGDLTWAKSHYDTIRGRVTVAWRKDGGKLNVKIVVPANTTATVCLPALSKATIQESGQPLDDAEGVRLVSRTGNAVVIGIGSGSYQFKIQNAEPKSP